MSELDQNIIARALVRAYHGAQWSMHVYNAEEFVQRQIEGRRLIQVDSQVIEWLDEKIEGPEAQTIRNLCESFKADFDKQDAEAAKLAILVRAWPMEKIIEAWRTAEGREEFREAIESFLAGE